ncbi:MAG: hypothetical protein EPO57_02765 [Chitinophagaceae bacterium]|nr:MAG: hypothetical protein EPO57_02765 [Chitinophagaceae bacterium]
MSLAKSNANSVIIQMFPNLLLSNLQFSSRGIINSINSANNLFDKIGKFGLVIFNEKKNYVI